MRILLSFTLLIIFFPGCAPSGDIEDYRAYFHDDQRPLKSKEFSVTYFGVSALLIEDGESQIMIDGFFTRPSASKVVFGKLSTDDELLDTIIRQYHMKSLDAVLVNHGHYDHALDAATLAKKTSAKLYGSRSVVNLGRGENMAESDLFEFEAGDEIRIGDFKVNVIAGKHSPTKVLNADLGEVIAEPLKQPARYTKYKEGGTFDFLISKGDFKIFVKPSPNFIEGALKDYDADVAFLATGSIGTQNKDFINQYYKETVGALHPKLLIPIHWDNFLKADSRNLVMMPWYMLCEWIIRLARYGSMQCFSPIRNRRIFR